MCTGCFRSQLISAFFVNYSLIVTTAIAAVALFRKELLFEQNRFRHASYTLHLKLESRPPRADYRHLAETKEKSTTRSVYASYRQCLER